MLPLLGLGEVEVVRGFVQLFRQFLLFPHRAADYFNSATREPLPHPALA